MDNFEIADMFSLLAKLMDIHGDNGFKAKSYANTAFQLEKITEPMAGLPLEKLAAIKGIGSSAAQKIVEITSTGSLKTLTQLIQNTPPGVLEMLHIKGIGPKKIHTIWKEMDIESLGELLYACNENRLTLYKGFGEKTQLNIKAAIEYYESKKGHFLYQQIEGVASQMLSQLQALLVGFKITIVGNVAMQQDTVEGIDFVTNCPLPTLQGLLATVAITTESRVENTLMFTSEAGVAISILCVTNGLYMQTVFEKNSSPHFLAAFTQKIPTATTNQYATEQHFFEANGLQYLPPYLRHLPDALVLASAAKPLGIIETTDVKGIIHSHSNWSDGSFSIEQMALAAQAQGFEYLVLSDHSKSAYYANGLQEERIKAQHQQIEELNQKLKGFTIFKSIESDILNDGSLDYSDAILSTFDLVIASVHSNLKMTEEKAMQRLLTAIQNPYTSVLGHPTGRLLLSRPGYPINHQQVIDACIANDVAIELNAHPRRLDMDWSWLKYAIDNGALISINPDAHTIEGFADIKYGVMAAQKALVKPANNLSSFGLQEMQQYLMERKEAKGILPET